MKKVLCLVLALTLCIPFFSAAVSAAGNTQGVREISSADVGDYRTADGEYFFADDVSVKSDAFDEAGATVVCFAGKTVNLPSDAGLADATVIVNNAAVQNNGNDAKFGVATCGCKNWFAFDVLSVFGKTVLAFFYEPQLNAEEFACFNELVKRVNPDLIYFDSLNGKDAFYVEACASFEDIITGKVQTNPGFIVYIMIKIYRNFLDFPDAKKEFAKNPGLDVLSAIIRSLFRKKK